MRTRRGYFILGMLALAIAFFAGAAPARAADLTVSPAVIDDRGVPDDIMNYTLTVTNTSGRLENIFASVYELTTAGAQAFTDPAASDRPALLADWISVSRGAMLFQPGETKTVPVSVTINPYAIAGDYHAVIAFVAGGTRDAAEQQLDGAPQALVNFSVASNVKEQLALVSFGSEKRFLSSFPVAVSYAIQNSGDVSTTPAGNIIFYDRIGHEIGSVDANPGALAIAPGDTHTFTATWAGDAGMGQYKASLDVHYGAADGELADTALFWVLPWRRILTLFGILLLVVVAAAAWLHRRYAKRHRARQDLIQKLLERPDQLVDLRHHHDH